MVAFGLQLLKINQGLGGKCVGGKTGKKCKLTKIKEGMQIKS